MSEAAVPHPAEPTAPHERLARGRWFARALDSEDLQRIKTPPARGGIIQEMDMLSLSIPREHTLQNIDFQTAAQRKPVTRKRAKKLL